MIGLESYDNRTKETWRGWAWNQLRARITDQKRRGISARQAARDVEGATVLYLPGPDDFDRQVAIAKGFSPYSLIAVDIVAEHVASVRRAGYPAICARLEDVLVCWPQDWPIQGVIGDLCGGMNHKALSLLTAMVISPGTSWFVGIVNMQRGRDAWCNWIRNMIKTDLGTRAMHHRAVSLACMLRLVVGFQLAHYAGSQARENGLPDTESVKMWRHLESIMDGLDINVYSYPTPTTGVLFDSLAFTLRERLHLSAIDRVNVAEFLYQSVHELKQCKEKGLCGARLRRAMMEPSTTDAWPAIPQWRGYDGKMLPRLKKVQRRLAALRARRTQLINASDPDQAIAHKGTPERMLNELCYR